jgi:hypothetical protein
MREEVCRRIWPLAQEFKAVRVGGVNFWIKGYRKGGVEGPVYGLEYDVPSEKWKIGVMLSATE